MTLDSTERSADRSAVAATTGAGDVTAPDRTGGVTAPVTAPVTPPMTASVTAGLTARVPHGPHFGERELGQAVWRGWKRRCPCCGTGPMMKSFLKVRDTCPVCSEELHHQRADDGPAYLTILVVGHALAPMLGGAWSAWRPDPAVLASVFSVVAVVASLWLLPRFKGMMVGFQWAKRMHGFAGDKSADASGTLENPV